MHPFGFFTAALKANSPSEFSFGTIEDIENLLLISRFGAHYNIGEHNSGLDAASFKVPSSPNL